MWSFNNGTAINIIVFDVDNSLPSHADNHNNIFLVLGEDSTLEINGSFGLLEGMFSIIFIVKKTPNFA